LTPFDFWRFAIDAQSVMWRRSLALLAASPAQQGEALARMVAEKQRAAAAGAGAAMRMALRGGKPQSVLAASLGPARKRVRRNLTRKGLG
jgi:hypothetical protein